MTIIIICVYPIPVYIRTWVLITSDVDIELLSFNYFLFCILFDDKTYNKFMNNCECEVHQVSGD